MNPQGCRHYLPLLAALTLMAPAAHATAPGTRHWHFTALLDDRVIGTHDFTVRTMPDGDMYIESAADFRVTALKIPLYTYVHRDREEWHGGCLSRIAAMTHDNGSDSSVSGSGDTDGLRITNGSGTRELRGCIRTFAYWDREAILGARQLLNSDSGDYEVAVVRPQGTDNVTVAGHALAAEHLTITTSRFAIELWYSSQGEWLALRTHTSSGRTLRYEIRK